MRIRLKRLACFALAVPLAGLLVSCAAAISASPTATRVSVSPTSTRMPVEPTATRTLMASTATPSELAATPAVPPAMPPATPPPPTHRIGVRVVSGLGEFYDRLTGQPFVPRGNNLVRLAWQEGFGGDRFFYHSNFNAGLYDPLQMESSLRDMQAEGYNVVRVFVQGACRDGCLGDPSGALSSAYMANVADFLHKAKTFGIYVIVTMDGEPGTEYYTHLLDTTWSEDFGGANSSYLRQGGMLVGKQFWQDFITALLEQGAPLDAIFAYELRNELFFEANAPPLSLKSGIVQTANGKTYDMASEADRQRMMDENLVLWIDQIRAAILEADPTALVTVGFFWPQKPHPSRIGDPRLIDTRAAIWQSSADFLDLHPYPGTDLTLTEYVDNFGMAGMEAKPILMGEFGAAHSTYSSAAAAARALHDWQVESCGYGFDGWLLWTWNSDEQTDFYNGLADEGLINQALAPAERPDPCQPGAFPFFEHNLALGKSTRASLSLPEKPASNAVDGESSDWWGAGDFAPQWIEIDLGEPATIRLIRLISSQSPPGETRHQIWIGPALEELSLLHTLEGYTMDNQVLEFIAETPVENARYVRVVTLRSPSWVSWREIEVLGP